MLGIIPLKEEVTQDILHILKFLKKTGRKPGEKYASNSSKMERAENKGRHEKGSFSAR